jgi:uncharacterized protein (TIGR03382 family)
MPLLNPAVYHLLPRATGTYAGTFSLDAAPRDEFQNDFFTFTSLSLDDSYPTPAPIGAQVWMKMTILSAPTGAEFSFWESGAVSATSTLSEGGGFSFTLSEPATFGIPPEEQDPYGHIHGRAFTATTPGDYLIGFQLFDASQLGVDGGPLIESSPVYTFQFSVVPEPGTISCALLGLVLVALVTRRRKISI